MKIHGAVKIAGAYFVAAFLWNRYGAGNIGIGFTLPLDVVGMVLPARQAGGI